MEQEKKRPIVQCHTENILEIFTNNVKMKLLWMFSAKTKTKLKKISDLVLISGHFTNGISCFATVPLIFPSF